jgi:hypothetical protein
MESNDLDLLTAISNRLNEMLAADRNVIEAIFMPIYVCSVALSQTDCHCFKIDDTRLSTNVFGVLLGAMPLETDRYTLTVDFVHGRIAGFHVEDTQTVNSKNSDMEDK